MTLDEAKQKARLIHAKLSEYKNHAQVIEKYFKSGDKSEIERLGIKFTKQL
jgi:hypothetical protein